MNQTETPSARTFVALAIGAAAFTLYGSLVPFVLRDMSELPEPVGAHYLRKLSELTQISSKSDFVANYLLGGPLGFCLLAALRLDKPINHVKDVLTLLMVWPWCILFAAGVEFLQLFFKDRSCTGSDIFAQSLGSLTGMLVWLVAGHRMVRRFRRVWQGRSGGTARRLLIAYMLPLGLAMWLPLNLTLSPAELYHKNFNSKTQAVYFPFSEGFSKLPVWLELMGLYFPAGMLAAGINRKPWDLLRGAGFVFANGLLLAMMMECGQLFVESRTYSITDVFLGGLGFFLGWLLLRLLFKPRSTGLSLNQSVILLQAWMFYLLLMSWYPLDFHRELLREHFQHVEWIPFKVAYEKNYLSALEEAVTKTLLFTPIGAILAATGVRRVVRKNTAILAGMVAAAIIEAGQLTLPGRIASPTDLIFGGAGAWLGAAATLRLRAFGFGMPTSPPPSSPPRPVDFVRFKVK